MFASVNDVCGKAAEAKRNLAAEEEKCAEEGQRGSEDEKNSAKFAEMHAESLAIPH